MRDSTAPAAVNTSKSPSAGHISPPVMARKSAMRREVGSAARIGDI